MTDSFESIVSDSMEATEKCLDNREKWLVPTYEATEVSIIYCFLLQFGQLGSQVNILKIFQVKNKVEK